MAVPDEDVQCEERIALKVMVDAHDAQECAMG